MLPCLDHVSGRQLGAECRTERRIREVPRNDLVHALENRLIPVLEESTLAGPTDTDPAPKLSVTDR